MKALATLFGFNPAHVNNAKKNERIIWFQDEEANNFIIYQRTLMGDKETQFACYLMLKENCDLKTAEYDYRNGASLPQVDSAFIKALEDYPKAHSSTVEIDGKGYTYRIIDSEENKKLIHFTK